MVFCKGADLSLGQLHAGIEPGLALHQLLLVALSLRYIHRYLPEACTLLLSSSPPSLAHWNLSLWLH